MKIRSLFLMFLFVVGLYAGCSHFSDLPSVCDTIPSEESVLCDMAKERDIRVEDIGTVFIVANAVAIGEGLYTKEQAIEICRELRDLFDDPITYVTFKASVMDKVDKYPGLLDVALSYLGVFNFDVDIYPIDRQLIVDWLDEQILRLGG